MKLILLGLIGLLLVGCQNSFHMNVQPTNDVSTNNPAPTPSQNSSQLFYYDNDVIGQIDVATSARIPLYSRNGNPLSEVNTNGSYKGIRKRFFVSYNENKVFAFDTVNLSLTEVASNFTGIPYASGNTFFKVETGQFNFVYENGQAIPADTYYGLDGVVNTTQGAYCSPAGQGYFVCKNNGTNPNKILILKTDANGNRGFQTHNFPGNFTSINPQYGSQKSFILYLTDFTDSGYYHFSYTNNTLTRLNIETYSLNFINPFEDGYLIRSETSNGSQFKVTFVTDEAGTATELINSTTTPSVLTSYWYGEVFMNAARTKFYIRGSSKADSTLSVLEVTNSSHALYSSTLDAGVQTFLYSDKFHSVENGNIVPLNLSSGTVSIDSDLTLNDRFKAAYCAKRNLGPGCPISISNTYLVSAARSVYSNDNYLNIYYSINSDNYYSAVVLKNNGEFEIVEDSDNRPYYYYLQIILNSGFAYFINMNPAS